MVLCEKGGRMTANRLLKGWVILLSVAMGCSLMEESPKKTAPLGLIATPASYYSTQKARYLGGRYKENLDRLVDRIVRNPKTANLQFANNIASVGGIGFFTHSTTKTSDERYLEVVLGAPETFETKGDYSAKVYRLFFIYGTELLSILSSDSDIAQEKEVNGYGLNFSWRNIAPQSSGSHVVLERAVAYFAKDRVRAFLKHEIDQNRLLGEAVIFAVEENGPMNLVSYRPQEGKPDVRPPIREENLAVAKPEVNPKPEPSLSKPVAPEVKQSSKSDKTVDNSAEQGARKDKVLPSASQSQPVEKKAEVTASAPGADKTNPSVTSPAPAIVPAQQDKSSEQKVAEQVKLDKSTDTKTESPKHSEKKPEVTPVAPAVTAKAQDKNKSPSQKSESSTIDISADRRDMNSGPDQVPTKSDQRKAAPAKVAGVAPEQLASSKTSEIAQKPVEKMSEPVEPSQRALEPKVAATPSESAANPKTAEVEPVAKKSSEVKQPEKPVEHDPTSQPVGKVAPSQMTQKSVVEVSKTEAATVAPRPDANPPLVTSAKPRVTESSKSETASVTRPQETVVSKTEGVKAPARPAEVKKVEPPPAAPKSEVKREETKSPEQVAMIQKAPESREPSLPVEKKKAEPASTPVKTEVKIPEAKATSVAPVEAKPFTSPTPRAIEPVKAEKIGELKPQDLAVSKSETAKAPARPAEVKKVETPPAAPRSEERRVGKESSEQVAAVQKAPEPRERLPTVEKKQTEPASTEAKSEVKIPEAKSTPVMPAQSQQDKVAEKSTGDRVTLLKDKPGDSVPDKKDLVKPVPKALEGYIIQLAFSERKSAQRWAETLQRRGYAVSVTEAGGGESLRVRIGNFGVRDEAERQLRTLRQEGLSGIIINLPQAYRPEARAGD